MVLLVDQLRELQWEKHIDDLWQEVLSKMEYPAKKVDLPSLMVISLLREGSLVVGVVPILGTY